MNNIDWKIVAPYLALIVTITLFIVKWRIDRKRPRQVICREIGRTSLVRIKREAQQKIEVFFDGKPVEKLSQLQLEISNGGDDVIKDIKLKFKFSRHTEVLVCDTKVFPEPPDDFLLICNREGDTATLTIPYLNPKKHHKQKVQATFTCDGVVEDAVVSGGSEGWSVSYQVPTKKAVDSRKFLIETVAIASTGGLLAMIGSLSTFRLGGEQAQPIAMKEPKDLLALMFSVGFVVVPLFSYFLLTNLRSKKTEWVDHGGDYRWTPRRLREMIKESDNKKRAVTVARRKPRGGGDSSSKAV